MKLPRSPRARQATFMRKVAPGAAGGMTSIVAQAARPPLVPRAERVREVAEWSSYDAVAVTAAGSETSFVVGQRGGAGGLITAGTVFLTTAGSSSTVVTIYVNGVSKGTITYASSDTTPQTDSLTATWVDVGDRIAARVTTAGTGAKGLSVFVPIGV